MTKDSLLDMALDALKVFYCWRIKIFEEVQKTMSQDQAKELVTDVKLVAVSILFVCLKLLNVSERVTISVFDTMCEELENGFEAKEVNHLSGIIFGLLKKQ